MAYNRLFSLQESNAYSTIIVFISTSELNAF